MLGIGEKDMAVRLWTHSQSSIASVSSLGQSIAIEVDSPLSLNIIRWRSDADLMVKEPMFLNDLNTNVDRFGQQASIVDMLSLDP